MRRLAQLVDVVAEHADASAGVEQRERDGTTRLGAAAGDHRHLPDQRVERVVAGTGRRFPVGHGA